MSQSQPISSTRSASRLLVRGQVQGVGFRPYVCRLAIEHGLAGHVANTFSGVRIVVEGAPSDLDQFLTALRRDAPGGARIEAIEWEAVEPSGLRSFVVEHSEECGQFLAPVPRDRATCSACRDEIRDPADRRYGYPFTNCTQCGPRYSILTAMPYQRPCTAMRRFVLCARCDEEYRTLRDRRFHAEPVACAACGPRAELWNAEGQAIAGPEHALDAAAQMLERGWIVALKGLGGFQLLTLADNTEAVARLRERKQRPRKPFAVMVRDLDEAQRHALLDEAEQHLLTSSENPIVLVHRRSSLDSRIESRLAPNIAPGLSTVGLFLPTTPLHQLLLDRINRPLVVTSGNRGDEPIITDERQAVAALAGIADGFLIHDRPIVRRLDDSVARLIDNKPVVMRLGRGYAPTSLPAIETIARRAGLPPILATGGHLKSAVAAWTGTQAILGPHIGDLNSPTTRTAFEEATLDLADLYRFQPAALACDRHPDYFTTRWAHSRNLPVIAVQHHHAHAVACMAENQLLDREVLALCWDGTGYGSDGTIWGGELLRVHGPHFDRVASLLPFPLPGGESAIRHPHRVAFALLWQMLGQNAMDEARWLKRLKLPRQQAQMLAAMIASQTHCPFTTSIGRLFDAVAALILDFRDATYEGEAAVALEAIADASVTTSYPFPMCAENADLLRGDWRPMLHALFEDIRRDVAPSAMAAKFHNTLACWAAAIVNHESLTDVVLTGGCFQNRYLAERIGVRLRQMGRRVWTHRTIPPGDGGLAAGQLAVAVMKRAG